MAKPYGLANQKLHYSQMLLNIEKCGEWDKEHSQERLVNTSPGFLCCGERFYARTLIKVYHI